MRTRSTDNRTPIAGAHRGLRVGVLVALTPMIMACPEEGGSSVEEPMVAAPVGSAKDGAPVPAEMRTVQVSEDLAAKGKPHFATCAACHGENGEGRVGQGPRLNSDSFLAAASDDMLFNTIKHGRPGTTMVPWGGSLGDDDIRALIAYMRSWNDVEAAALDESPLKGDADEGGKLYAEICAACHGRTGAGYQETANGTGIGRAAFLSTVTNGFLRYLVKHGKSQTKMRPFDGRDPVAVANLSDEQIENVIAYLRKNAW